MIYFVIYFVFILALLPGIDVFVKFFNPEVPSLTSLWTIFIILFSYSYFLVKFQKIPFHFPFSVIASYFIIFFLISLYLGNETQSIVFFLLSLLSGKIAFDMHGYRSFDSNKWLESILTYFVMLFHIIALILWYFEIPLFDFTAAGSENFFRVAGERYRLFGTLVNPNAYAFFAIITVIFLFFDVCNGFARNSAILITVAAIYLTGSRSGLACLLVVIIFYILSRIRYSPFLVIGMFLLLQFLVIFTVLLSSVLTDIDIRFSKWLAGWEVFTRSGIYIFYGLPMLESLTSNGASFSDNMFLFDLFRHGVLFFTFNMAILFYFSWLILSKSKFILNGGVAAVFCFWLFLFTTNSVLLFPSLMFWFIYFGVKFSSLCQSKFGVQEGAV